METKTAIAPVKIVGIYGPEGIGKKTTARVIQNQTLRLPWQGFQLTHRQLIGAEDYNAPDRFCTLDEHSPWQIRGYRKTALESYLTLTGEEYDSSRFADFCRALKFEFDENVFIDSVFNKYDPLDRIIIPDVETAEEYEAIKEKGGIVIKMHNSRAEDKPYPGKLGDKVFDFKIDNCSTPWFLIEQTKKMMWKYKIYEDDQQYKTQPVPYWLSQLRQRDKRNAKA